MSDQEPAVLTVEEVAKRHLRVSERTVYRLIDTGQLAAFKVGAQWRITRAALTDYIQRHAARPQRDAAQSPAAPERAPGKEDP